MATTKQATRKSPARSGASKSAKKVTKRATAKRAAPKKVAKRIARKATRGVPGAAKKGVPAGKRATSASPRRRDAIAELKHDHRTVEELFKRFERAGDNAHRSKRQLVDSMIEELSRHAAIEEQIFYPAVRAEVSDTSSDVLEALEEHHVVKVILAELEGLDPRDERFDAKVTVMAENVRHHVREEEHELFPEVREGMDRARLRELGEALRDAKPRVPTRPHPGSPDEPPANVLVGGAVAMLDRARTAGKQAIEHVRDEVIDVG